MNTAGLREPRVTDPQSFVFFFLCFFLSFFLVKRGMGLKNFRLLFACCTSNRQATEVAKIRRHSHKPLSTARRGRQLLRLEPMRHET